MDLIWYYNEIGKGNDYIELQVIKEYLYDQIDEVRKEIKSETEQAFKRKMPEYLINIFVRVLKDREDLLKHLVSEIQEKIKEMDKLNSAEKKGL